MSVLLVKHLGSILHLVLNKVGLEVNKSRLYRLRLCVDHLLQEVALLIVVCWYWCYSRLVNLVNCCVCALTLVNTHIVVGKIFIGKGNNLFLCHIALAIESCNNIVPVLTIYEGIFHSLGTCSVIAQRNIEVALLVGKNTLQKIGIKLTFLQLIQLFQDKALCFFKFLSFTWQSLYNKNRIVGHSFHECSRIHHLHRLVKVHIKQSSLAVSQHIGNNAYGVGSIRCCLREFPS